MKRFRPQVFTGVVFLGIIGIGLTVALITGTGNGEIITGIIAVAGMITASLKELIADRQDQDNDQQG